ncbi:MAG: 50S ribosomal protein L4 [Nitrososphaerales archaeon]
MSELNVYGLDGSVIAKLEAPKVFNTPFRPDVIRRVFWALFTHRLQPQGRDPLAGERTTAISRGVGLGIARLARVKGGGPRAGQAAGVAGVVKGRQAHPPKAEKIIWKDVNEKEKWLATASAAAATALRNIVVARGHKVDKVPSLPLIVSEEIETISKLKDLKPVLTSLGLMDDVLRAQNGVKRRSGKPRMRGRTKRVPKGPLFVVAEKRGLEKATANLPGVECVLAKDLSVLQLAPGGQAGRLVVWSKAALQSLPKGVLEVSERFAS